MAELLRFGRSATTDITRHGVVFLRKRTVISLNIRLSLSRIRTVERSDLDIRVATLERTLVDVLDRPELCGGWEETWKSLESVEYFDLDLIVEYVKLLGNRTTAAKVGYYLQRHAKELMVDGSFLDRLRQLRPAQPHYLERGKRGRLMADWNLVVPASLTGNNWEEVR